MKEMPENENVIGVQDSNIQSPISFNVAYKKPNIFKRIKYFFAEIWHTINAIYVIQKTLPGSNMFLAITEDGQMSWTLNPRNAIHVGFLTALLFLSDAKKKNDHMEKEIYPVVYQDAYFMYDISNAEVSVPPDVN